MKIMNTPIVTSDLTQQAPHSPRNRIAGFAIASRTLDKCRADLWGKLGEYHYDCPLDRMLFTFKGITGEQFKMAVQTAESYEAIGAWLLANGIPKTPAEIKAWSDEIEAGSLMKNPEKRDYFMENCAKLGLDPETTTTFDWLEADDRESFGSPIPARKNGAKAAAAEVRDQTKMYVTGVDILVENRVELNALMNRRLASAVDLQMQLKQAHWNVKGPSFIGLHELFDKVGEAVELYVDLIAERIVQLGGIAEGTVRVAGARSQLDEYPLTIADGMVHVVAVATALSTFGHEARLSIIEATELDDADTADLFTEVSRGIDKWLWFVQAHSQATK
jgi:starvation-inducible DNA-binding protein